MAFPLGIEHFRHASSKLKKMAAKYNTLREKYSGNATKVVRTLEVGAGALIGGVIQGRAGEHGLTLLGVPVEALAGLALGIGGHIEGGTTGDHMGSVGDGLIASYVNHLGFGIGRSWRDTGKLFGGHHLSETKSSGALPPGMNAAQMADMITRMQTTG